MSMSKLITKITIATIIFIIVMFTLASVVDLFMPILENDAALG